MSLPESITLNAEEESLRLWNGARTAMQSAPDDLVALCEALDLGLRSAEILLVQRLQPVKERFPATIAHQLQTPEPRIEVLRDAVETPKTLQFAELLDLLSDASLDCVGPRLHRGWEDRRFSCARSRKTAHDALGIALDAEARNRLLLLAAYRNRIFRCPPPIRISPGEVMVGFDSLKGLMARLHG